MKISAKQVVQYIVSLSLAVALFWYLYGDKDLSQFLEQLKNGNWYWIIASVAIGLWSHISRAWRWSIALRPFGYTASVRNTSVAVLIGYLANLFVPRAGEFVRCGVLKRTNDIPVNVSFGAVIAERAFDMVVLLTLITITVLAEFDKIGHFFTDALGATDGTQFAVKMTVLAILGIAGLIFVYLVYRFRQRLAQNAFVAKLFGFIGGLKDGLLSVKDLSTQDRVWYLFHTISIWASYYFMAYCLFFLMPETADLGMMSGLSVLVMGGIGMVLPTPGGVGSYHFFVTETFVAYGVNRDFAAGFAFFMHSAQTVFLFLFGLTSLIILLTIKPILTDNTTTTTT